MFCKRNSHARSARGGQPSMCFHRHNMLLLCRSLPQSFSCQFSTAVFPSHWNCAKLATRMYQVKCLRFSSLVQVLHLFILEHTCVGDITSLNSNESVTAYACWSFFLYTRLCTLSQTEYQESSLPAEQGVQTYQILLVWGHDPSTHVRRARFLTPVGDLI